MKYKFFLNSQPYACWVACVILVLRIMRLVFSIPGKENVLTYVLMQILTFSGVCVCVCGCVIPCDSCVLFSAAAAVQ